ncbi:MAG: OmpA family protein [Polyangiaceae bacterium]|nr:OmpA family protein [Polyangiaceae bacterium]NUN15875.1 OmpA family protein [Myxococcales bacterium]
MMVAAAFAATGCTAKASIQAGANEPKKEAPPPPAAPEPAKPAEPAHRPKMKMTFKLKGNQVALPGPVVFETGSDVLRPESDEVLSLVHDFLQQRKDVTTLRIEGHTDSDGDDKANQTLSEKRAMAVARWLVAKGDDCKRLLPVGFGETKPIADNTTPEGKAQNRRTDFIIAAVNGKAVDGAPIDGGGKNAGDPCK